MFSANSSQVSEDRLYVEDVFSTWLYTGTGSTQTITNGIDLAGKGGLVWFKARGSSLFSHQLYDTARGATIQIATNSTSGNSTNATGLTAFTSSGFTIGSLSGVNSGDMASWTFREAPKFFDIVTWSGNDVNGRSISHSLGVAPGTIIVKKVNAASSWVVYHRSLGSSSGYPNYMLLQTTDAQYNGSSQVWNSAPTATSFSVGNASEVNESGGTYVAYLYAHDTTSDGIIQCGSFTTDGSSVFNVTLGWEPQWVMIKRADSTGNWMLYDNMRGMPVGPSGYSRELYPNTSDAEANGYIVAPNATGFSSPYYLTPSATYIYIAIRRGPMRTPTSGTSVFAPDAFTSSGSGDTRNYSFSPDLSIVKMDRPTSGNNFVLDRLRGWNAGTMPSTSSTSAETASSGRSDGSIKSNSLYLSNSNVESRILWNFCRAPSFFDEVCYTGTGVSGRTVSHNLGVVPELTIIKARNWSSGEWFVLRPDTATTYARNTLDGTGAQSVFDYNPSTGGYDFAAAPSATQITLGSYANTNSASYNYVAYLFASCPGVSKVGSYTGNGSSQTINCGFAAGARFIMIKRTDSTGDWYVWDTARGIVAGNDPRLSLNSTAAEVTTDDSVDTDSSGFVVNQLSATNINVSSATYIYLAVA